MLQLCLRLLSSRLAAGIVVDELIIIEKMKKQASVQKDSLAALQLQNYLGRLKQKHVLTRRLQVLCVLANLSFSPDSAIASYVDVIPDLSAYSLIRSFLHRYISFNLPSASSPQRLDLALTSSTSAEPSIPAVRLHKQVPLDSLPEAALLRDCLFVMHGIDGQVKLFPVVNRSCVCFDSVHRTEIQRRSSSLLRSLLQRLKSTSRRHCPRLFVA
jgi:hypothetical protein